MTANQAINEYEMKLIKFLSTTLLTLYVTACHSQDFHSTSDPQKFNLGFEINQDNHSLADGWIKWGDYDLSIDTISHSGHWSGKITSIQSGKGFGSIAYKIPAKYQGDTIRLEGYMKIRNVKDGFAGLLLRLDGHSGSLEFDNMRRQNVKGTKDWKKYAITLFYPEEAENIYVAGILVGEGEAWFDDFELLIDGKDVQEIDEVEKPQFPAQLDHEYDHGSSIQIPALTKELIDNLELLGRVWGFLKYHHPAIAKGNLNWDYQLFRFLPGYLQPENSEARDELIVNWIDNLGKLDPCLKCAPTKSNAFLKPDHQWIVNQSSELKEKLMAVYKDRHIGEHYYIGSYPNVGNPQFKNEHGYPEMGYPDDGFRLLALFRYWNIINYFFPYRHLMDKEWNRALPEYLPIFLQAGNELEYELAVLQLIAQVQDTHANLWGGADKIAAWKGQNYPPINVRFVEEKLVVTDYFNPELKSSTGLEIGDIITTIDGQTIEQVIDKRSKFYPASNSAARLRDIATDILRSNSRSIDITYISQYGSEHQMTLKLYPKDSLNIFRWYKKSDDKSYKMLENKIGYVTLQTITDEDVPVIMEEFEDTKGIIMDIRNYPSAFVPFSFGSHFVSTPTPFVKFTNANVDNPGEFNFIQKLEIPVKKQTYKGKLVVLVNEFTQSSAEYTAMAFKAGDNTTIVGSTTAGADGNISRIILPGGLQTIISGIGVYYPDGTETQRVGIVPDITVKPTVQGIRKGKDEPLEKAIEFILND